MQELSFDEVDMVSGGNPVAIGVAAAVVVFAFAVGVYNGYEDEAAKRQEKAKKEQKTA